MVRAIAVLCMIASISFIESRPHRVSRYRDVPGIHKEDAFQLHLRAYPRFHDMVDRQSKRMALSGYPNRRSYRLKDHPMRDEDVKVVEPRAALPPCPLQTV